MDKTLQPWEEDGIGFLEGDWTIRRADIRGLYTYVRFGVAPRVAVDAAQLVEWGMAAPIEYELLTPWRGSGITFVPGAVVMRDLLDSSTEKERGYIIVPSEGEGPRRVNRFWLVRHKLATGDASFEKDVGKTKLKKKQSTKVKPWEGDDIVMLPAADGAVERGAASGMYRVKRGYVTLNWTAARLVEHGFAVSSYDMKLETRCSDKATSFKEIGDGLFGYWLHEKPQQVRSLTDIAKMWHALCADGANEVKQRVTDYNLDVMHRLKSDDGDRSTFDIRLASLRNAIAVFDGAVEEAVKLLSDHAHFRYARVTDDISAYDKFEDKAKQIDKHIVDARNMAISLLAECRAATTTRVAETKDVKPVPCTILPEPFVKEMRHIYDDLYKLVDTVVDHADRRERIVPLEKQIDEIEIKAEACASDRKNIVNGVNAVIARRRELGVILAKLGKRLYRPPSIFHKTDRRHSLRFLTGVKITRHIDFPPLYYVHCDGQKHLLSVDELIYMGLAERI